ncbi:MAG: polynucleotide kinase-phosphatase [Magnetococcales bacterium]|nr:polynucleotide kinase-phosphatase [Magnetococcales bacterium]
MKIEIPELSLVLLVGATASGKSTFASRHFLPTEVVSSDGCRAMLVDDENDQKVTPEAFDLLRTIVGKRLKLGRLTVVDATHVQKSSRKMLIELAREYHLFCIAIVFDLSPSLLEERHARRGNRPFSNKIIHGQCEELRRSLKGMEREGIRHVYRFQDPSQVEAAKIHRVRLWTNRRDESGPFDIIGDVHGCLTELETLLERLGYRWEIDAAGERRLHHPDQRRVIFLGDLVDRGPDSPGVVRLVRAIVESGMGLCVAGNHDVKLARALRGKQVTIAHGLERSLEQFAARSPEERAEAASFLDRLIGHYVLDNGRLVVAHAGMKEEMQGRSSARTRDFALYGETSGEVDVFGLPVRLQWARSYRGESLVVYGHTPVEQAEWLNHTLCLDTGCVFGGQLSALRYPEKELVAVPAERMHHPPTRPLVTPEDAVLEENSLSPQQQADDLLDFSETIGLRRVVTTLAGVVRIDTNSAAAAMEMMSREAIDPKWLIHLPPTMSPSETAQDPGMLESPKEAFDYYRRRGVVEVICQEKHMGSRAIIILCRTPKVSRQRFGLIQERLGVIHTRTGRPFFTSSDSEQEILQRLSAGMETAGLWEELQTDWVCLDAEILPWSIKAMPLIRRQFAPVAVAGESLFSSLCAWTKTTWVDDPAWQEWVERTAMRHQAMHAYRRVLAHHGQGDAEGSGLRVAPFHLLASEGKVHDDQTHLWHLSKLSRLAEALPDLVTTTAFKPVDLHSERACAEATDWWQALTAAGGEGMVVKPATFVTSGSKGMLQPAIKCRGPEYLRLIYGPEYLLPENLERLRPRALTTKRKRALQEFALGLEGLHRFVARQPLREVHACAFAILALESEPVDPRL